MNVILKIHLNLTKKISLFLLQAITIFITSIIISQSHSCEAILNPFAKSKSCTELAMELAMDFQTELAMDFQNNSRHLEMDK
jgi:hypothetical protein